jgi:hypothetical protein
MARPGAGKLGEAAAGTPESPDRIGSDRIVHTVRCMQREREPPQSMPANRRRKSLDLDSESDSDPDF